MLMKLQSANNDKKTQLIYSIEIYVYETSKCLIPKNEEIKCNNMTKNITKMIDFDDFTGENMKKHNPNQPQNADHPYRILIIGGAGSG